jgi:thiamine biosynthesis lipoprotein
MTIPYRIVIAHDIQDSEQLTKIIETVCENINVTFNNWNPHSEVSKLNQLKAYQKVKISKELKDLLLLAKHVHEMTEGRFDPTVGPLVKQVKMGKLPSKCDAIGFSLIHLEDDFFWKDHDEVTLDLCAIAKGHAVDLVTDSLLRAGYKDIYVEWGGEIRTAGRHPEGRSWIIATPDQTRRELVDQAIATSGNYIQNWEIEGKRYTHIIDPRTKMPLEVSENRIKSATVIASSCAYADAIATALMVFTKEEERVWASVHPEIECLLTYSILDEAPAQ